MIGMVMSRDDRADRPARQGPANRGDDPFVQPPVRPRLGCIDDDDAVVLIDEQDVEGLAGDLFEENTRGARRWTAW